MQDLTLVIPAKYESESLPHFLKEISNLKCKKLIVLEKNDIETMDSIKNFSDIDFLYQNRKGYGAAIIAGILNVSTTYFCIINADGSMNPKYLGDMLDVTKKKNLDFLFASRYEKPGGGSDDDSSLTLLGNYIFTKIGNIFFSLEISDILFTYVLGKTKSFNSLNLVSNDFSLCVELPIKAKKNKFLLDTIPSFERSRIAGKKKVNEFKDGLLILCKMITLFFKK